MAAAEAWDIRDPAQRVPDPDSDVTNWTHLNSVSIGPRGNVVLSFRARNQVVSLSADLRAVEWQLHGPDSDFEFPNPDDRFFGQHTAQQLDHLLAVLLWIRLMRSRHRIPSSRPHS